MKGYHNISKDGPIQKKKRKRGTMDGHWTNGHDDEAARDNEDAVLFDYLHFKALLYDWIISDNVSFNQLESDKLRALLGYLNPRCKDHIPSHQTVSRHIGDIYDKSLGSVTEALQSSITKINLSFDLWTSKNKLALLGTCAHFLNNSGVPVNALLALPRQKGKHSGYNVSETVSDIIAEYGLQEKIGYFTTDNASSNQTCLDHLAQEHGFERDKRWIRCSGHIFNLVAQAALFGKDNDAFVQEIGDVSLEEQKLLQWRKKGPIGKLHNVVYWINRSTQRSERFEQLQRELITPIRPDGKKETYELIKDVETRWNSFDDSAERALYLQPAIDELLLQERSEHDDYVYRQTHHKRPVTKRRPAILDDALSADDWHTIRLYHEILKPVKDATLRLQGHGVNALWQVLPSYEKLLKHFETLVTQYPVAEQLQQPDPRQPSPPTFTQGLNELETAMATSPDEYMTAEHHLSTNIKLAWQKLDEYYEKLDNNPVYVAAVVLHPNMKWQYLENRWQGRTPWLLSAKKAFNELTLQYHYKDDSVRSPHSVKRAKRSYGWLSDDDISGDEHDSGAIEHQLAEYLGERRLKTPDIESSPIPYWMANRSRWPRLAIMALDIYSAPVMSDEPERVFSTTGAAVSPRRRLLQSQTIGYLMCLKAWIKSKLITIDRYHPQQATLHIMLPC
jgi:hypothetical protein